MRTRTDTRRDRASAAAAQSAPAARAFLLAALLACVLASCRSPVGDRVYATALGALTLHFLRAERLKEEETPDPAAKTK
jgi:hypothetical protein